MPAATWGEKEGTMTNWNGEFHEEKKLPDARQEARADSEIVVDFARRLEAKMNKSVGADDTPLSEALNLLLTPLSAGEGGERGWAKLVRNSPSPTLPARGGQNRIPSSLSPPPRNLDEHVATSHRSRSDIGAPPHA
ncbi:MAG: molybdopterin-dependent oxidoreductase [Rhodocyclaceae bacterium]|nr:molybdopterin-dependent oxidoreductase [Rhodocyclaceae bacterium]